VSAGQASTATGDGDYVRRLRRQVEHTIEQLAALSGSTLPPGEFYDELLRRGLDGIDAPAGAIWIKSPQGFLQQQCQQNVAQVGLDDRPDGRAAHNQLLRFAFEKGKPGILGPRQRADGDRSAGNPTDYLLALAPILTEDNQTLGLVEVFQKPTWNLQDLITYTIQVAGYASNYLRNTSNRKVAGQEQVWTQLEVFSRQVHGSLNPTEVAYVVANEGRRLIGCDRVSVGIRHGRKTTIEAVSGADVVEKASTHIRRMRDLFDAVIQWGEKLVFRGVRDETLPPKVLEALDAYLAEQTAKLLVLVPIRDEREKPKEGSKEAPKPARSGVLMEMFDPPELTAPLEQKLDVIAAHSTTALYNAAEMKRVPLKPLWWPLMKVQQGMGGKARFWTFTSIAALVLLTLAFTVIPYPLKLDATGKLAPLERYYIYSPQEANIKDFLVYPNQELAPGQPIAVLYNPQFQKEITQLKSELYQANQMVDALSRGGESGLRPEDQNQRSRDLIKARSDQVLKAEMLQTYERVYHCDISNPKLFGQFTVTAPVTHPVAGVGSPTWKVLTQDFREQLTNKPINPKDPLMRVGHVEGGWEIVLKIPQKHMGKLLKAFTTDAAQDDKDGKYLWVDVLPISEPTPGSRGRGKLYRDKVTAIAEPNRDDQNESEPVVYAYVRINTPDIPEEYHLNPVLLVTDLEVKAKVIGGDHSLGYSLFYGMWEFLYEKVVFWF
jgi:hypothetical protein